jgi:hypothetical protein
VSDAIVRGDLAITTLAFGDRSESDDFILNNDGDSIYLSRDEMRWLLTTGIPAALALPSESTIA